MKNWDDLFTEKTPYGHEDRVLVASQAALEKNRVRSRRRFWLWLAAPLATGFAGAVLWMKLTEERWEGSNELLSFFDEAGDSVESSEDLDMIAELELLEVLDEIEDWEDV
jgi:hypothetical protein